MKFEDYTDYVEAKKHTSLIVFGSVKNLPLCEILRSNYDTSNCPITEQIFNPTKRISEENFSLVLNRLTSSADIYTGSDKEKILKNIELLKSSFELKENFFHWDIKYGSIFDDLCSILKITIAGRIVDRKRIQDEWSYEKNMAFWAGAIEKRRPFALSSPYYMYQEASNTTIHEMLWLHDNGYFFEPIMTGSVHEDYMGQIKTLAIPPYLPLEQNTTINITDYRTVRADQILNLFNTQVVTALTQKVYSNPELNLLKEHKQYQDMYNDFVAKFNNYFSVIFPEDHKNLETAISKIQNITQLKEKTESFTDKLSEISKQLDKTSKSDTVSNKNPCSHPTSSEYGREAGDLNKSPKFKPITK